ncbi:TonB-dependent receptor domain-containing protein [Sphingomonas quercus]|uniref:TonB-dependent receptor n=1 Tax=Sphingomonas quercus TaxID=2842451 RepID=A0ABS6BFI0_9SPHN|nr:TonB-dependent receptor [Sphingomonas quercus]MBU3077045.1 TonB-dependent receptor [Sphingomonas quercus]
MATNLRGRLLASTLLVGTFCTATPLMAQDQVAAADTASEEAIVVTGTRIFSPTLSSPVPVTSVSVGDLTRTGDVSVGDQLNNLPSLRSSYSSSNSTQYIGTTGLNILDLRGLGVPRTLVLVNGRRHITSVEGEFQIDTNTIPTDLLERVDIVTGGSSAVYGSDAMAGVVNFVLKKDFEGVNLNAQGGITSYGDRGTYRLSGTFGTNFSEGRGNIAVSLEYSQQNLVTFADRPKLTGAFAGRRQFQLVDDPSADNTIPNRQFLTGVHSYGYSNGGSFISYSEGSVFNCSDAAGACLPNGFPRVYLFQPDGTLKEGNYGTDFRPVGSGNNQGGDGATLNDTGTLNPRVQRYVANLVGHYDFSDAFRPFVEAKFVRVKAYSQGGPTFSQGGPQGLDGGAVAEPFNYLIYTPIMLDNAYLNPQARATIQSLLPAGSTFFALNRNNVDLGTRDEAPQRDTWRVVVGAEGTFNDDWHYDVSVDYGHLKTRTKFYNNRIEQNFYNAIDAVRNGAGQIVCRVNQVTVTDPGCQPLDILGNGRASQAALDYINTTSRYWGKATELDISANLAGDSSQLFELPGGPVRFAIGAEYRRETAAYHYDDLVTSGATFLNAIQPFNPPSFAVKEAYGELEVPLLSNLPFVEELSLNGAARVADYKGSAGTVWAYNYGVMYAPIRDIKFRANYSRSVRAPTLGDLYSSPSQDYDSLNDPCDANFINAGKASRPANCAAAGVPVGFQNTEARAATLEILSGGNSNLTVEKSRSITFGAIIQPRWVPGLTVTLDYYDVKISNVIQPVEPQTILDGCYDAPSLDNTFCKLIYPRDADHTFGAPALLKASVNYAAQRTRGLDVDVAYNHRLGDKDRVQLRFIGNWVRTRTDYPYLDSPDQPERIKGELGDPIYAFNASIDWTHDKFTLGYQLRYIGKQSITDWEAQHTTYGVAPLDPYYADRVYYPSVTYHNIRATLDVNDHFQFYGGVDNLTNKMPPLGVLGTGSLTDGDAIYDNIGRMMYVGVRVKL